MTAIKGRNHDKLVASAAEVEAALKEYREEEAEMLRQKHMTDEQWASENPELVRQRARAMLEANPLGPDVRPDTKIDPGFVGYNPLYVEAMKE